MKIFASVSWSWLKIASVIRFDRFDIRVIVVHGVLPPRRRVLGEDRTKRGGAAASGEPTILATRATQQFYLQASLVRFPCFSRCADPACFVRWHTSQDKENPT